VFVGAKKLSPSGANSGYGRLALPPENVGAISSRIFDGAPAHRLDFTASSRKQVGSTAEGSTNMQQI